MPTQNQKIYGYNSEGDKLAPTKVSTIHWYRDNRCYVLDPLNRILASGETITEAKRAFREAMKCAELEDLIRPKYRCTLTAVKVPEKELAKFLKKEDVSQK